MKLIVMRGLAALFLCLVVACGGGGGGDGGDLVPIELVFTEVATSVSAPTGMTHAGDGSNRLFLLQQTGQVRILDLDTDTLRTVPFLDIFDRLVAGGEQGLLGLAFPPILSGAVHDHFYVYYTSIARTIINPGISVPPTIPAGAGVLSRFNISNTDPNLADPASEEVLLVVPQPATNHNGGHLAFGPFDGFLYLGLGDGGGSGDPNGNGQNRSTLLGSILRLDVENGLSNYTIPAGNPFVGDPLGADEIWVYGLRNPWRFSFDRSNGNLYIGDVGQATWEEIDFYSGVASGGANFGWNVLEGDACFNALSCTQPTAYVPPVVTYDRSLGNSVTGGYVYRGPGNPDLQGAYLYGDFGSGRIWSLRQAGNNFQNQLLTDTAYSISTFGEDEAGRLYLADYATGTIQRIDQQ